MPGKYLRLYFGHTNELKKVCLTSQIFHFLQEEKSFFSNEYYKIGQPKQLISIQQSNEILSDGDLVLQMCKIINSQVVSPTAYLSIYKLYVLNLIKSVILSTVMAQMSSRL